MITLSITPLDTDHVDEICADIVEQQKTGVSTHAMFFMQFHAEGTPAVNKAELQCRKYDIFREKLDRMGAKHGVLVQATLGHIFTPFEPYPFQPVVSFTTGEERISICCPMDPDFKAYIKEQMRTLAKHHPSMIMIDDDIGLLYRPIRGCACKRHMDEFNRRAGTNLTREELWAHTQGDSTEDKRLTQIYVDVQRDALVDIVKAMREGIDEVDPTIQGAVSGIYAESFVEFSDITASAFAGKGNPVIARYNGGIYSRNTHRGFTRALFAAAELRENTKHSIDYFIAETDCCPYNRYSTSAALLHSHYTALILEGAAGAKHWITRLWSYEPAAGKAYRKTLSKYAGFYERLVEYTKELRPFGCRIPLTKQQDYRFVASKQGKNVSPWSTCVLGILGLPLYFSNEGDGAVFLDDISVNRFDDDMIREFLHGTLVLSSGAADALNKRGFAEFTGVEVEPWNGAEITTEYIGTNRVDTQYAVKCIKPCHNGVEQLSRTVHIDGKDDSIHDLFPGVTRLKNKLGGEVIVFAGSPDMPFAYSTSFSFLNSVRKNQLAEILGERGHVPVYYEGDVEMYVRAGYLENGEILCALFNTEFDKLDDIPLVCTAHVSKIERLECDGSRSECDFVEENGVIRVQTVSEPYIPVVLFIS